MQKYEVTKGKCGGVITKTARARRTSLTHVAERKMRNEQVGADLNNQEKEEQTQSLADQLLGKMAVLQVFILNTSLVGDRV